MYPDTQFLSGKEQEKALKQFKKVIDMRDAELIAKSLYNHLYLHCGFIAHYDIFGFRQTYSGQGFRDFVEHFDLNNPKMREWSHWLGGDYTAVNHDMAAYVTSQAPMIYAEMDEEQRKAELAMENKLLEEHAVCQPMPNTGCAKGIKREPLVVFEPNEEGQLAICF